MSTSRSRIESGGGSEIEEFSDDDGGGEGPPPISQQVYPDALDVTLKIDGVEWYLIEARVELTTADIPDYVDMILHPKPGADIPKDPTKKVSNGGLLGTEFTLDVDTELEAGPRGNEITRLFTGQLANLSTAAQGAWEGIAWDPSHQSFQESGPGSTGSFMNSKIDITNAVGASEGVTLDYPTPSGGDGVASQYDMSINGASAVTKVKASNLAQEILEKSPLSSDEYEDPVFADDPGILIGVGPDGIPVYGGIDKELQLEERRVTVKKALTTIENSTRSVWWFDREGVFHIGAPRPGNPIESWNLQFIIETDAGLTTPAWQSVQVIGSGVASEDGWDSANMNAAEKYVAKASLAEDGRLQTGKLQDPVYTYRNLEIQTQAEANDVAKSIVDKLQDQRKGGKITVVGFPEIRPYDAVQMPQAANPSKENFSPLQPMGGTRYSVTKVVHKLNGSDGFITEITTGGLASAQNTLYNDEAPSASEAFNGSLSTPATGREFETSSIDPSGI
jgi:hypothetical protein